MAEALLASGTAIVVALIAHFGVRRPMKKEHNQNAETLGHIRGQVDLIVDQSKSTEQKIDDHIADHARGAFDDDD